jgi:hypothetical protein
MKKIFIPIAVSLLAGLTAQASVFIINENFDPALSAGAALNAYGPGGNGNSGSTAIVAGDGVGGTSAWESTMGASGSPPGAGYAYYGPQYQNGGVTGNTSANLSDYTLSFDAAASSGVSLNIQIQSWTLGGFQGSQTGTLNTAPANPGYGNDISLTTSYQHYSFNLGNTTVFQGNTGFLPNGGTIQMAFQLDYGAQPPWTVAMDIDNLQLTMATVPEPTIMALSGMGISLTGLLLRRRLA